MPFQCGYCKHWQGTKCSEWGMCNRIILMLFPEVYELPSPFEYKKVEGSFDPHDFYTYYYRNNALLRKIKNTAPPKGVIRLDTKEDALTFIYNKDGEIIGERTSRVYIPIYYVHRRHGCQQMFLS